MVRPVLAAALLLALSPLSLATDPALDSIDRAILVQKAMADAKDYLAANDPAAAAAALEAQLPHANVNRTYLELLRKAYDGELQKLRVAPTMNLARHDAITKRLSILNGTNAVPPAPEIVPAAATKMVPPPVVEAVAAPAVAPTVADVMPTDEWLKSAAKLFNQGTADPVKYRDAAELFAKAHRERAVLSIEQLAAWAYCRVKLAADELNQPTATVDIARAAEADVREALALVPGNAGLQKAGEKVLASARLMTGGTSKPASADSFQTVEAVSVRVRHRGADALAQSIATAAGQQRQAITAKWFGPTGAEWTPKCEITIHPTASAFASATGLNPQATGRAEVSLDNGTVTSRRIDLRADDPTILEIALPRELAHIVMAELFPSKPPPRWAEEALAIHSTNAAEVSRYLQAAARLAADGQLPTAPELLASTGFPAADRITGFYVASVGIAEYLIEKKGDRAFAAFLTDAQRYGIENALRRQYNLTPAQLESAWRRPNPNAVRGQAP
jgi:hypothetical protein